MKYTIVTTRQYRKACKKIKHDISLLHELEEVITILTKDSSVPKKYKDHALVGKLNEFRELHVRPDVLLVYQKQNDVLVLLLANLGSHSDLF